MKGSAAYENAMVKEIVEYMRLKNGRSKHRNDENAEKQEEKKLRKGEHDKKNNGGNCGDRVRRHDCSHRRRWVNQHHNNSND